MIMRSENAMLNSRDMNLYIYSKQKNLYALNSMKSTPLDILNIMTIEPFHEILVRIAFSSNEGRMRVCINVQTR